MWNALFANIKLEKEMKDKDVQPLKSCKKIMPLKILMEEEKEEGDKMLNFMEIATVTLLLHAKLWLEI